MDTNELKKMLKNSTAVLILDNGEPSLVVVDYNTYRDLVGNGEKAEQPVKVTNANGSVPARAAAGEVELLERINKDILALKAQIEDEEKVMTAGSIDEP